jgi:hypothetical protein
MRRSWGRNITSLRGIKDAGDRCNRGTLGGPARRNARKHWDVRNFEPVSPIFGHRFKNPEDPRTAAKTLGWRCGYSRWFGDVRGDRDRRRTAEADETDRKWTAASAPTFSGRDGAHHTAEETLPNRRAGSGHQPRWRRRWFSNLARRRTWLGAGHAVLASEQTKDLARRARSTWRGQARPALSRKLLADELVGVPPGATGSGWRDPDCRELLVREEVGDLNVNLPCPQLAWHLCERRNGSLGEVSIPLRPSGLLAIG